MNAKLLNEIEQLPPEAQQKIEAFIGDCETHQINFNLSEF